MRSVWLQRLSNLLCVKSIVTIILTVVFAYLSIIGKLSEQDFLTVFSVVIPGLMGAGFLHVRDRAKCCAVLSAEGFAGWKLPVVLFPGKAFSTAFFFACIRPDNLVL